MKNIYFDVKKSIKDLQKIFENTDGADEGLREFNQEALELFKNLESESLKELESLKNNEEWEKFTIAFYGETGAGKSTLIECLRLFFKEPSKMDQQERFKRLYANMKNYRGNEHAELKELQDGAIIGDGRSDCTLETKSYTLKHNNQSFVLLDIPGIEGDEKKVKQQISNATKKAHAIFYVTKTPASPQKGEERKEGTIEKIQKQLDSQTEVYTLFNKPINSPRALKDGLDGLIDENEKESLKILNEKMKAILGKHYMGYKAVSAQAAFYGLSSALLPETDFYKNKQKFLKFFKVEELLLYKSHFKQLGEFIAGTLLENSRKKIMESNCNKAVKVIEKLQKAITTTIDRKINPTIKELKNVQLETYSNLDRSRDKFVSKLKNSVSKEIERFKSDLREEMYAHIDRDIEDDECKEIFENECKQGIRELSRTIEGLVKKCEEQFRKDIKEDIEQFEERIKDSLVMLNYINLDSGFDSNFNIHSGIDKLGLFSSIGGLILLFSTVGGFALAAGIVLGVIGVVKSVWSWFSSDYKKSQQKKEVDKNLDKVCGIIKERVRNQIKSYKKIIFEKVESLKAGLNDSVVCYECMREGLIKAGEGLWHLSNNIKTRIAQ
ncbi:GTPase [Helicobacter pylori]|uniref:GTPase n=1 Tax=Helicobacter pylori TaxID=210 RepID=UPI001FD34D7E|nr:GTPase [Helicobacter pylori]UOS37758.1 50S ribosome-binding GTPase [Helicobacter pylori]